MTIPSRRGAAGFDAAGRHPIPVDRRNGPADEGRVGAEEETVSVGITDAMRSAILENLSEGVYFVDRDRRIVYWNKAAEAITGYAAADVVGRFCHDNILNHCTGAGRVLCGNGCPLRATIDDGNHREVHVYLRHKDGHRQPVCVRAAPILGEGGEIIGAAETFSDDAALARSRRRAADLERAVLRDALTGVASRRFGELLIDEWLTRYQRLGRRFGVLFIDVDRFKAVNDRFGHETGDRALRAIAATLSDVSRTGDEVIRWGGEEFLVLVSDANITSIGRVARRLRLLVKRTGIESPDGTPIALTISVGGTLVTPADTKKTLIPRADSLQYASKTAGGDRVVVDRAPSSRSHEDRAQQPEPPAGSPRAQ